jgi:hypothetical protein
MEEVLGIENRITSIQDEISNLNDQIINIIDSDFSEVEKMRLLRKKRSFEHDLIMWKSEDDKRKIKDLLLESNIQYEKRKELIIQIDNISKNIIKEQILQQKEDHVCLLHLNKAWANYYGRKKNADDLTAANANLFLKLLKSKGPNIKNISQ